MAETSDGMRELNSLTAGRATQFLYEAGTLWPTAKMLVYVFYFLVSQINSWSHMASFSVGFR